MGQSLTETPLWHKLAAHKNELEAIGLTSLIERDPNRLKDCALSHEGLHFNYAFNFASAETIDLLVELAKQQNLEGWRTRMASGEKINTTEKRAVLHMALRQKEDQAIKVDDEDVIPSIRAVDKKMSAFVKSVREGTWKGATGKKIRHIINIGIGGSDLGPRMVTRALDAYATGPEVHFAANLDAFDLTSKLKNLDPSETLFVIVSKTFTTQETLLNAETAKAWLIKKLGKNAVPEHFVAVSQNQKRAEEFGIKSDAIFSMWDWIGGRFSLWSAVGLSIALAIGMDHFKNLKAGAASMDKHFCETPLHKNIPVLLALFSVWHRNFWQSNAYAVLPYSDRLSDLPRYLQQLEMESNGKTLTRDRKPLSYATAPLLFGECGTVGQHSFHQWLHQGSDKVPVDFIGIIEDDLHLPAHHEALLANMVAQAGAFAFGQSKAADAHDVYEGGRSSNILMLDRLDPFHLGLLIALYEHKVFAAGVLWEINSFDQPGVELGKKMAKALGSKERPIGPHQVLLDAFFREISEKSSK